MRKAKTQYTDYISTIGLRAYVPMYNHYRMLRALFSKREDDATWDVQLICGETLLPLKRYEKLNITSDKLNNIPSDAYDDAVFAFAAFRLFGAGGDKHDDDRY